jgi:hypothetical protein
MDSLEQPELVLLPKPTQRQSAEPRLAVHGLNGMTLYMLPARAASSTLISTLYFNQLASMTHEPMIIRLFNINIYDLTGLVQMYVAL